MGTGTRIRVILTSLPAHATSVLTIRGETRNGPIRYIHMAPPGINLRWNVRLRFYQYATFDRANGNYLPYRFVTHVLRFEHVHRLHVFTSMYLSLPPSLLSFLYFFYHFIPHSSPYFCIFTWRFRVFRECLSMNSAIPYFIGY